MIIKDRCIVLNSIRWKDSSKIVTLFSRESGRIKVIAKGAYRKNSPFSGQLESLNLIQTIISEKAARSLQILTEAESEENFQKLRMMPEHFPYAFAILEIINQIFEYSHSESIFFDFISILLKELEKSDEPETVFWYFLLKTTSFLGFKPDFATCNYCHESLQGGDAIFSYASGQVICPNCQEFGASSEILSNKDKDFLILLQRFPYKKASELKRNHPKQNLTPVLLQYLNYHLDKQLTVNALSLLT